MLEPHPGHVISFRYCAALVTVPIFRLPFRSTIFLINLIKTIIIVAFYRLLRYKMKLNLITSIVVFCIVVNYAIAGQPGGAEFIGKSCDPAIYNRVIKPSAEAHEIIELEYKTSNERRAHIEKLFLDFRHAVEDEINMPTSAAESVQYEAFEGFVRAKGCNGFAELYLTCDSATNVCVCKTEFPFNNTMNGTTCIPQLGSICALGDDDAMTCANGAICHGDEGGLSRETRYCGGDEEFEKYREARLKQLKKNNNSFRLTPDVLPFILSISFVVLVSLITY